VNVSDPGVSGIVTALNQSGGNITGFALYETPLVGKWLELLLEIAPWLKRAATMFNPDTAPVSVFMPSFETAARSLRIAPIAAPVHDDVEIETAIFSLGREPLGGRAGYIHVRASRADHFDSRPKQRTGGLLAV
jgi:putative tryptophan/tyrosine transport system substrate-binding protein